MIEAPKTDLDLAKATVCEEVADLYSDGARELGARFIGNFFQTSTITPIEVLHSFTEQNKLSDAGTTLTQAIQKIASLQVRGLGVPVSTRINTLYEMTDQLRKDTREYLGELELETLTPENIKTIVLPQESESDEERRFRIFANLTHTLSDAEDWAKKFEISLALGEALQGTNQLEIIDIWIADALRFPKAYSTALGQEDTLGEEIKRLMALCDGDLTPNDAPTDPKLAAPLYQLLWNSPMKKTRATLLAHAVKLFITNDRLLKGSQSEELDLLNEIVEQFKRDGELIGGKETSDAAEKRYARLLSNETIDLVLDEYPSFSEKMLQAIKFHKHAVGEKPRLFIEGYVQDLMKDPRLEQRLEETKGHELSAVAVVGKLNYEMLQSGFAERTQERLANDFAKLQSKMIEETEPFDLFCMAKGKTADKLITIIDLISDHSFTEGANEEKARSTARMLMTQPDFLSSFLAGISEKGQKAKKLRNLEKRLIETGLA